MTEFATDFDVVWAQFPRHTAKAVARKAWNKLNPDTETVQLMIEALKWQTQTEQWQRGVIPHLSTWLRQERWTDQAPAASTPTVPASEMWRFR